MNEALQYFYLFFNGILNFLFNAEIADGVSIGWIFIAVLIIAILIKTLAHMPTRKGDSQNG